MTQLQRVAYCGRYLHGGADFASIRLGSDGAGWSGLQTCGSVWACPVCSAAIRQGRSSHLESQAARHLDAGGGLVFLTLTVPHDESDPLRGLLDGIGAAWKTVQQSRGWRSRQDRDGLLSVKAVEITRGRNGWHPHLHLLLFTDRPLDDAGLVDLRTYLERAWPAAVLGKGLRQPNEHGVRLQPVSLKGGAQALAAYLTKVQDGYGGAWSIGSELVRGDLKSGRRRGVRTPFDIAEQAANGDADAVALWHEYEAATKGRNALTVAPALKARYPVEDATDEDLAAAQDGETVAVVSRQEYELVVRYAAETRCLDVAELRGAAGVYEVIAALWRRHDWEAARAARAPGSSP